MPGLTVAGVAKLHCACTCTGARSLDKPFAAGWSGSLYLNKSLQRYVVEVATYLLVYCYNTFSVHVTRTSDSAWQVVAAISNAWACHWTLLDI